MSARDLSEATPPSGGSRWFLKLYPRDWRERYGDELSELVGDKPLSIASSIDLIAGAIDARFSKGTKMPSVLKSVCLTKNEPQTAADGLRGAGIMIGSTLIFVALATLTRRSGWPDISQSMMAMSFPVSMVFTNHVMYLRKQSATAKWVITGGSLAILSIIGVISTL
jgi:hypothetical protein